MANTNRVTKPNRKLVKNGEGLPSMIDHGTISRDEDRPSVCAASLISHVTIFSASVIRYEAFILILRAIMNPATANLKAVPNIMEPSFRTLSLWLAL